MVGRQSLGKSKDDWGGACTEKMSKDRGKWREDVVEAAMDLNGL